MSSREDTRLLESSVLGDALGISSVSRMGLAGPVGELVEPVRFAGAR